MILFIFLAVALAIYIIVMVEAVTDKGLRGKLKKETSETEEKGEEAQGEPAEKPWPPKEEPE